MPLLFRFELFDLKVAAESVGLPREKWLYRVACQRGKSRETKRADYTGRVAFPPLSCPFFEICTTQFFQLPTFRARTRRTCIYVCVCQGQDPGLKRTRGMEKGKFFFLDDSRLRSSLAGPPKPTDLVFKIVFSNLCAV